MKLINSVGPNPQVVRMFAAERAIDLPTEDIDLMAGENRQAAHLAKNPAGQSPCLALDDGSYLSEVTVICEYLDEVNEGPSLIGDTPLARAEARMWTRRVDLNICEPMANGFRFSEGLPLFKDRIVTVPEAAEGLKRIAQDRLTWLDKQLAGKTYLCGDRLTLADILLYCFLAFGSNVGQPLNPANANVQAWFERMAGRPSAKA
jgi:glutathione S-transferase